MFKIPFNLYESGSIPQVYNKNTLVSSYVTSFKEEENNFDKSSNYNRYYTTSSFKFTTGKNIGPRVYTLTGVTDILKNETIGFGLMVKEAPTGSAWDSGSSLILESASLKIHNYNENGVNSSFRSSNDGGSELIGDQPTFELILNPNWTSNIDQPYNLDLYDFSDYNPTVNNAEGLISNDNFYIVEREGMYSGSIPVPENIDLMNYKTPSGDIVIIAEPSTVNNFNYEQIGAVNARYDGSKYTSAGFNLKSKDGLGNSPAEQRTSIFLNCLGAGGQTPEVKDATAFFFNTVIDDKLNIYPSTETDIPQFIDIHDAYAPGIKANVNISPKDYKFTAYDGLSGQHHIIGIGQLQTLITTGQGINAWNYVDRTEFEGADVENFQDFYYKKIFTPANTTLGAYNGELRAYNRSPWVKEAPSDGVLQGTNEIPAVGESSIDFSSTTDWMTVPFPDEVISVNPNSSADAGYTWNGEGYSFDFDTSNNGVSPEVEFLSELPILWLGHAGYRYGGSYNDNNGKWEGNDEDNDTVIQNSPNAYLHSSLHVKLKVRLRLIKGNGEEENVEIINWPNSTTEYTNGVNDNELEVQRGLFGPFSNNSSYINPSETPIYLKSKPRTYQNGDVLKSSS